MADRNRVSDSLDVSPFGDGGIARHQGGHPRAGKGERASRSATRPECHDSPLQRRSQNGGVRHRDMMQMYLLARNWCIRPRRTDG